MLFRRSIQLYQAAKMGLPLDEIVKTLQSFAPLMAAESWDNVGLLVDPMSNNNVEKILLTNDLTEDVVNEAKDSKAGLIVSYHPNIFKPLKTVNSKTWKERIIVQCIKHEIAVFSPHTSWDNSPGGVSDWLASLFTDADVEPIQNAGRFVTLRTPLQLRDIVEQVKKHLGVSHLQLGLARNKNLDSPVTSVALCAGSGGSVLNGIQADLFLTGEMSHHEVLDATQSGIHVILSNHSNSERGFLKVFKNELQNKLLGGTVDVVVSQIDKDPLISV